LIKYNAAVIGLGQIGLGYDYQIKKNNLAVTHSSAFNSHPSYELVGGVDIDKKKRILFEKKYKKKAYSSIEELMEQRDLDILAICVPTEHHYDAFLESVNYNIKIILCEKPFSSNLNTAKKMIKIANKNKTTVIVNYIRRFNEATIKLKKDINKGRIGYIKSGKVWYCKGLLNNGSHFIDLMIYFFGFPTNVKILNNNFKDDSENFEPDFQLEFSETHISFFSTRTQGYSFMELDLIGSEGRIRYTNNNIYYYKVKNHKYFDKTNILKLTEKRDLKLKNYQYDVLESINKKNTVDSIVSNGESAILTLNVISEIKNQLKLV